MKVLITGGSGLIGTRLSQLLLQQGYSVAHLSRQPTNQSGTIKRYHWDIDKGIIDSEALLETDYLIHLAGAGIADERWSDARKAELIASRTKSIELIAQQLASIKHHIKGFTSAAGIGYYGADTGDDTVTESYARGNDFLSECSFAWEEAGESIKKLGIRTTKLRTGIVLAREGGALPKLTQPIRYGVGAALGSGKQYQSWIHLDDICRLFIHSIENETMQGAYNAVAPTPVRQQELIKIAAQKIKMPLWLPNVPAFLLRLFLGEMACLVLGGNKVINQRIANETTFEYSFTKVEDALSDLLP
jgi:uncharacterized protein (TIGR01777 family)